MERDTDLACFVDSCKLFSISLGLFEGFSWRKEASPRDVGASQPPAAPGQPHLPGLAASPARVRRDPQRPAAAFPGQEGELTHSTANEGP